MKRVPVAARMLASPLRGSSFVWRRAVNRVAKATVPVVAGGPLSLIARAVATTAPVHPSPADSTVGADAYDPDRHVAAASALLQQSFGPQARVTLNALRQRQTAAAAAAATSSSPGRVDADADHATETPPGDAAEGSYYYRASATFRLLAFPVELAAVKSAQPQEAVENCLRQALSSDVEFLLPQKRPRDTRQQELKKKQATDHGDHHHNNNSNTNSTSPLATLLPELRDLCIFFSRSVKFSIKPPLAAVSPSPPPPSSSETANVWRCRAYVRDDWDAMRRSGLVEEQVGETPRAALIACARALTSRYVAEKASPAVALAGVHELHLLLGAEQDKKIAVARSDPEASPGAAAAQTQTHARASNKDDGKHGTVTSFLRIDDAKENARVVQLRRQPSSATGLHTAAMLTIKSEGAWAPSAHLYDERLATVPLLVRLRWQFDCMVRHLSEATRRPAHAIARVDVGPLGSSSAPGAAGTRGSNSNNNNNDDDEAGEVAVARTISATHLYRATLTLDDAVVWQATSGGRYRVELDAYAQAVLLLLDEYGCCVPSLRAQPGVLYPTPALLELALTRHDHLNILTHHRGNWTGYAVLGTLTSQLLGAYYQTHYRFDPISKYWKATLTVQDGRDTEQVLIERLSLQKGEAWRHACLDALRENFPNQYAASVAAYPDMDLSPELMSRGGRFRALPRHKRVRHIANLFDLVAAFAEEDFGWQQLRVRLRNASANLGVPQWVAEMEALVDPQRASLTEEGTREKTSSPREAGRAAPAMHRIVVGESPAYTQVKTARRVLVYRLATQYFPNELAIYKTLGRGDSEDPEQSPALAAKQTQVYDAVKGPLVTQLFAIWEQHHPTLAPFSWQLILDDAERAACDAESNTSTNSHTSSEAPEEAQSARLLDRVLTPHHVQVRGRNGELLVRDEATVRDVSPYAEQTRNVVTSLMAALRTATTQLEVPTAERFWHAYETQVFPPLQTSRDLCVLLFTRLLGTSAAHTSSSSSSSPSSSLDDGWLPAGVLDAASTAAGGGLRDQGDLLAVHTAQLGDYWFATLTLPSVRHVPLSRAVHSTKRGSVRDALLIATRHAFRPQLEYLAANNLSLSALASEVLYEPIIEQLPEAVRHDLLRDLRYQQQQRERREQTPSGHGDGSARLHELLRRVQTEFSGTRRVRVQRRQVDEANHECRIYLDPTEVATAASVPHVARGQTQLIGQAACASEADALEAACRDAFHRLFLE